MDENTVMPVSSPWRNMLLESLKQVRQSLFMICPYIKDDVIAAMEDALCAREQPSPFAMRVITRALPDDFLSRSSDIAALQHLLQWPSKMPCSMEIRIINNVHAKVWLFDTALAIVGSGNATASGLGSNLEYGLAITEPLLVSRIQQDWQVWWEQATPTGSEELEQMRQWLERMAGSEAFHQLEVEAQQKRKAIERVIGAAPRIGKRLDMHDHGERVRPKTAKVADVYRAKSTGVTDDFPQEETSSVQSGGDNSIRVSSVALWRALCWICPSFKKAHTLQGQDSGSHGIPQGSFLKLACLSIPAEKPTLQCLWADGKRLSQATIAARSEQIPSIPLWAVTIDTQNLRHLAEYLRPLITEQMLADEQIIVTLTLKTHESQQNLHFASIRANGTVAAGTISCTLATLPGAYPVVRPPVSRITVQYSVLMNALQTLEQQWHTTYGMNRDFFTIELFWGTSRPDDLLTLSTGPLDAPLVLSIPRKEIILTGPPVRLRLDFFALQGIVTVSYEHDFSWCITTDRELSVAQFSADPPVVDDATLLWRHQLWNIIE